MKGESCYEKGTRFGSGPGDPVCGSCRAGEWAALGYDLEILEVTDYYVANPATASGEVDGNYFQHIPFLNAYNASVEKEEDKLVAAFGVHCEPYGIYPGTKKDLKDIAPGDKIAVTTDKDAIICGVKTTRNTVVASEEA